MSGQEDLQNWLNQLKKRSGAGTGQPRPAQPRPMPNPTEMGSGGYSPQPQARKVSQNFEPELVDIRHEELSSGKSATDIALEKLRQEEEALRMQKKREALAKRRLAEKNFTKQKSSLAEDGEAKPPRHHRKTAKAKIPEAPASEEPQKKNSALDISGIHYKLRNNPQVMKEALILSEIILPPLSLRDNHLDHF